VKVVLQRHRLFAVFPQVKRGPPEKLMSYEEIPVHPDHQGYGDRCDEYHLADLIYSQLTRVICSVES
jgi:hypothetical protein